MSPIRLFIAFIISLLLISCAIDYQQEAPASKQESKPAASSIEKESRDRVEDAAEPAFKRGPTDDDDDMLRLD